MQRATRNANETQLERPNVGLRMHILTYRLCDLFTQCETRSFASPRPRNAKFGAECRISCLGNKHRKYGGMNTKWRPAEIFLTSRFEEIPRYAWVTIAKMPRTRLSGCQLHGTRVYVRDNGHLHFWVLVRAPCLGAPNVCASALVLRKGWYERGESRTR